MKSLQDMFDLNAISMGSEDRLTSTDVDYESSPEDTLDRIFELRLHVSNVFGRESMYDHPFFSMTLPMYENKTPYQLACEGDSGLNKAIKALRHLSR